MASWAARKLSLVDCSRDGDPGKPLSSLDCYYCTFLHSVIPKNDCYKQGTVMCSEMSSSFQVNFFQFTSEKEHMSVLQPQTYTVLSVLE